GEDNVLEVEKITVDASGRQIRIGNNLNIEVGKRYRFVVSAHYPSTNATWNSLVFGGQETTTSAFSPTIIIQPSAPDTWEAFTFDVIATSAVAVGLLLVSAVDGIQPGVITNGDKFHL